MVSIDSMDEALKGHDSFFGRVVEMIPRDLYRHVDEEEGLDSNSRFHKHRKMPLQPEERKLLRKKRKKEAYEPRKKGDEEDEEDNNNDDEKEEAMEKNDDTVSQDERDDEEGTEEEPSAENSLDALRKRLKDRIASLKGNRSTSSREKKPSKGSKQQTQKNNSNNKSSAKTSDSLENQSSSAEDVAKQVSQGVLEEMLGGTSREGDEEDVLFSGLVDSSAGKSRPEGKSGSKQRRLKKLLEDTEKRKRHIRELQAQGEEGKQKALQEQWSDVLKEATGQKVLANTAKIKKTLKRKEKLKEKSAREWAARTANVETAMSRKQEQREENLLKRKRGPDWVPPPGETDSSAPEKKRGVPISTAVPIKRGGGPHSSSHNNSNHSGRVGGNNNSGNSQKGAGGKKSRAGFEGKKVEFLNKKSKK